MMFVFWRFLILMICGGFNAWADPVSWTTPLPSPQVKYNWINQSGHILRGAFSMKSEWVRDPTQAPHDRLHLLTRVQFLGPYTIESAKGDKVEILRDRPNAIAIFTDAAFKRVQLDVLRTKTQEHETVYLEIEVEQKQPLLHLQVGCEKLGITTTQLSPGAKYLYAELKCVETSDDIDVYVFYSSDIAIKTSTIQKALPGGEGWAHYQVSKAGLLSEKKLGVIKLELPGGGGGSIHSLAFTGIFTGTLPPATFGVTRLRLGLSFTQINYSEEPFGVSLSELALTGKAALSFPVVENKIDVSVTGFATLIPYTATQSKVPLARYFGLNGRADFQLPGRWFNLRWSVSPGLYLWGMLVAGDAYGVKRLGGPQIYLLTQSLRLGPGSFFIYGKFAPIGEQPSLIFSGGRELAIGGGYQPGMRLFGRNTSIVSDISKTNYASPSQGNSLMMTSYLLGLEVHL